MDASVKFLTGNGEACDVVFPASQTVPLVFSSPHSGRVYPPEFIAASRLDLRNLRKSEDCFVDEIFGAAPQHGAPLLRARFPRAYVDPNREPYELDASMFVDDLPSYANTRSPRVSAGLGTIARVVTNGEEIYKMKLNFTEVQQRIEALYRPYHRALSQLVEQTQARFGWCLLVDCHSMPSVGGPMDKDAGRRRVDFVLGDRYGTSCAAPVTEMVEQFLRSKGFNVTRNIPYAGGYTTRHYGRPIDGFHALQIEINRELYMDEDTLEPSAYLPELSRHMGELTGALGRMEEDHLSN